ncbi:hypothetical protein PV327_008104 [Microctonus hyperodae]|uniref:Double-motif LAGLIDADG homing endonuclease n=1 Tax=Microctonus hyperodae TaxID=165561 RepID=A0AA39F2E8_MICHY|nr:hypothetical protein PV327_008104 [Microctonus hyperodae]
MKYLNDKESELLTQGEVESGLELLSQYLYDHHEKKVFVLIDVVDVSINTLVHKSKKKPEDRENTIELLQSLIGKVSKRSYRFVRRLQLLNPHQDLGGILSNSANSVNYSFLEEYVFCEFYGFSDIELKELLEIVRHTEFSKSLKQHYNGYQITLKKIDRDMINGKKIDEEHEDLFAQLLYKQGFSYSISRFGDKLQLAIPNKTVCNEIPEIMCDIKSTNSFYNNRSELIKKLGRHEAIFFNDNYLIISDNDKIIASAIFISQRSGLMEEIESMKVNYLSKCCQEAVNDSCEDFEVICAKTKSNYADCFTTEYTEYDKFMEKEARETFVQLSGKIVVETGQIISKQNPWL